MSKLIVAIDLADEHAIYELTDNLDPADCNLKIGSEAFTYFGPRLIKKLIAKKFKIFLDLKFYDIPNTVAHACKACADLGVWMINVHASGGLNMMQSAVASLNDFGKDRPLLTAVTVLTSFNQDMLHAIGVASSIEDHVIYLSKMAKDAGVDGVVCSAYEARSIKNECGGSFIAVTPGIRLMDAPKDDQQRTLTPEEAFAQGSDYLVVGRPITHAENPAEVVQQILETI